MRNKFFIAASTCPSRSPATMARRIFCPVLAHYVGNHVGQLDCSSGPAPLHVLYLPTLALQEHLALRDSERRRNGVGRRNTPRTTRKSSAAASHWQSSTSDLRP